MSTLPIYGQEQLEGGSGAVRRLGDDLAPPRNLYLLYFPLTMLAAALICWVVPTDPVLAFGAVILAAISLFIYADILFLEAPLRISTILMSTLGLGYGLGAANTYFTLPRTGVSLGELVQHDPSWLTHTMGSVLFSMAVLLSAGEMVEKPLLGRDFRLQFPPQSVLFISVGVVALLLAYAIGALSFGGAVHAIGGQVSIFATFADWLLGTLFAITLVAAMNTRSKFVRNYLWLLTGLQFVLEIPAGRRNLIYTVVLAIMALRLGRLRLAWSWPKKIVIGLVLGWAVYAATIGFYYLRVAGYNNHSALSLPDRIGIAFTLYQTKDFAEIQETISKNVETRTFILGFLADVEHYSTQYTPGYGVDLVDQVLSAVPSAIYPAKNLNQNEEGTANRLFGTAYIDEANSVLTAGAIDFGLLGMVVYPLLCSVVLRGLLEFISRIVPPFVGIFIVFGTIGRILQPENTLTDYVVIVRNGLIFGVVIWFFLALPAFQLRREQ